MTKQTTLPDNVLSLIFKSADDVIKSGTKLCNELTVLKGEINSRRYFFNYFRIKKIKKQFAEFHNLFNIVYNIKTEYKIAKTTKDTTKLSQLVLAYVIELGLIKNTYLDVFRYSPKTNRFSYKLAQLSWDKVKGKLPVPEIKQIGIKDT